ncbi:MAG: recombination mediator RecR [Microthrixaceae bacterium]
MASPYAAAVQDLIDALGRLPGIGPKSAQRVAFHLLKVDADEANRLARAIVRVKERVGFCTVCFNIAEGELCTVCADPRRDEHLLCVVEEPGDVVAIERTREFRGRYHVLQGAIDHLQGVGPEQLKVKELISRVSDGKITEVIICTNPNLEGEATALYLSRVLDVPGLTVSRLSSGLPVGGDLEYADELTLGRALEGRRVIS